MLEYYVVLIGDQVRAAPKNEGFGRAAWLAPGIFLLIGGLFIGIWVRKKRHGQEREPQIQLSAEQKRKVEDELAS